MSEKTAAKWLQRFYTEIHQWIQDGFPIGLGFHKDYGLCTNLEIWTGAHIGWDEADDVINLQSDMFCEEYGDDAFPFNLQTDDDKRNGCNKAYTNEAESGTIYLNPERLAWINKHRNQ